MGVSDTAFTVTALRALEILDSRGNPTLRVDVTSGLGCHRTRRRPFRGVHRLARGGRAA